MRTGTETAPERVPEAGAETPSGSKVEPRGSGRRVAGLIGTGVALMACGAYAFGWIGETGLLSVVIAFVIYARATMGWFG